MYLKFWKSIFLIVGTSVGAGILALPITTAEYGFVNSCIALLVCWFFMTTAAFYFLQVRLCFTQDVDLKTMTEATLGKTGCWFMELSYFCLLYALISVYIIVGSAWTQEIFLQIFDLNLSTMMIQISFTALVAAIVYNGIGNLSLINTLVTAIMLTSLLSIIVFSADHIELNALAPQAMNMSIFHSFPMILTTLGFSIIIPSITSYIGHHRALLGKIILVGSLIIILNYILWEMTAFGVLGTSESGIGQFVNAQDQGTEIVNALSIAVDNPLFTKIGFVFMFFAVMSSLLGVGQCLFSFLQDVLPFEQNRKKANLSIILWTVVPLLIINLFPAGISSILGFAGIFVAIILGIVPTMMILSRYFKKNASPLSAVQHTLAYGCLIFFTGIIILEVIAVAQ